MKSYWRLVSELAAENIVVKGSRSEAGRTAARARWGTGRVKPIGTTTVAARSWEDLKSPEGGFTINTGTGTQPVEGYAVSIRGHSSFTPVEEFFSGPPGKEKGRKILNDWLVEKADLFDDPTMHIGAWHDPDTGMITLDATRVIHDRAEAIKAGRDGNQKAICDLAAVARGDWDNAFIDTGGTGT